MGVTVEIETPELMPDLVGRLAANGCLTSTIDERACQVVHIRAVDAHEEWHELRFFLRAWQARHGVGATLRPARAPAGTTRWDYGVAARSSGFSISPCS